MLASGSTLSYVGKWSLWSLQPSDAVAQVGAGLAGYGIVVRDYTLTTPSLVDQIIAAATLSRQVVTVKLELQLTGVDYGSADDVLGIISSVVEQVTGRPPESQSIPYVSTPGGVQTATGQPAPSSAPQKSALDEIFGPLAASLGTKTAWAVALVGLGIILVVVLQRRP